MKRMSSVSVLVFAAGLGVACAGCSWSLDPIAVVRTYEGSIRPRSSVAMVFVAAPLHVGLSPQALQGRESGRCFAAFPKGEASAEPAEVHCPAWIEPNTFVEFPPGEHAILVKLGGQADGARLVSDVAQLNLSLDAGHGYVLTNSWHDGKGSDGQFSSGGWRAELREESGESFLNDWLRKRSGEAELAHPR